jgi:alpha-beta hydrolase superfamily lysophospholipase
MRTWIILNALLILLGSFCSLAHAVEQPIEGHWQGVINQPGGKLKVIVDFKKENEKTIGTIEIPAAAIFKWPLQIDYKSPALDFSLPIDVSFAGEVSKNLIAGRVSMGDHLDHFYLKREPRTPLPYKEEEVRFQNGDVMLAGTLYVPLTKGPHPAVFLLQGSGDSDREAEWFYADQFARRGIAALTYDKRGVGASTGNWELASFDDFAGDALAGVHYLQSRTDIRPGQVGLYGRSHGGMVAPLAAARSSDVAFVINVSGNATPVTRQIIYDNQNQMRAKGYSEHDIADAVSYLNEKYEVGRTGRGWTELKAKIDELQSRQTSWLADYAGVPQSLEDLQFFWQVQFSYNPVTAWQKVKCPVLGIFGEKDTSTPVVESVSNIKAALKQAGNKDHLLKVFPAADHALLHWPKDESAHWPVLAKGFLNTMMNWLTGHVTLSTGDASKKPQRVRRKQVGTRE